LGITFQQIQKYEKGTNRVSASRLQHIARILSVPIPFFFENAPGESAEQPPGIDANSNNYALEFLSSAEGLQLNRAFVRIKDSKLRRTITNLVRALAGEQETAG
jgi:transcriptional regulator with XRE-family HTH domain